MGSGNISDAAQCLRYAGTRSGTRTHTPKKITDFKSVASANSAIRANYLLIFCYAVITVLCMDIIFQRYDLSILQSEYFKTIFNAEKVEPALGFEPRTDGLQNRSSTTELSWHLSFQGEVN